MYTYIEERVLSVAEYIIEHGATVRAAAYRFGISKSTVHKDMQERLGELDKRLFDDVKKIMLVNKAERHIRGGRATYMKYKAQREKNES